MGMTEKAIQISGLGQTAARASTVVGGSSQILGSSFSDFLAEQRGRNPLTIQDGIGTLVGAGAGYYFGKKRFKHPVLGIIAGASLGRNVPALLKEDTRKEALWNMGQTGAAVVASSHYKKHPVIAFLLASFGAGLVRHYVAK